MLEKERVLESKTVRLASKQKIQGSASSQVLRGGPQVIPRPLSWQPGREAPWSKLSTRDLDPTLSDIRTAIAESDPRLLRSVHPDPTTGARSSAVLAAMFAQDTRPHIVLTRRSWQMRTHKGEVSFPGGRFDEGDHDLATTALREAQEEVGLTPNAVEVVGRLDELSTFSSNAKIFPFVGIIETLPKLHPEPAEVDAIRTVSIAELLSKGVFHEEVWSIGGMSRPLSFFEIEGDTIWGATASMLCELLSRITGVADKSGVPYR